METSPTADRRSVLRTLSVGLGVLACSRSLGQPAERAAYVGVETDARTNQSKARFFTATGAALGALPLDFRAHGMAEHGGTLIVFPRRPGTRFAVVHQKSLEVSKIVTAPANRHFFGHGAFSLDGAYLLVTENRLDTLGGAIGVYATDEGYRRVGQVALPGPGPHEIIRHPARDVFFIALGGLETHPDYGRTPLNLGSFKSQIIALDLARSRLDPMGHWPGSEAISLRHLAVDGRGRLYVGGQHADPARGKAQNVLWLVKDSAETRLASGRALGGYVSSVAAHGDRALVSSKESGLVLELDGAKEENRTKIAGASAVALSGSVTAFSGFLDLRVNAKVGTVPAEFSEFDNHGLAL